MIILKTGSLIRVRSLYLGSQFCLQHEADSLRAVLINRLYGVASFTRKQLSEFYSLYEYYNKTPGLIQTWSIEIPLNVQGTLFLWN